MILCNESEVKARFESLTALIPGQKYHRRNQQTRIRRCKTVAFLSVFDFKVVAGQDAAVAVTQVHSAALAVTPHLAVAALTRLHPTAVTVRFEAVLPDIPKVISMDIALMVIAAYAKAARYGAVIKD